MDTILAESLVQLWNDNRSDQRKPVAKRDGSTFYCGDLRIDCDGIEAAIINKYFLQICPPPYPSGAIVESKDSLGSALGVLVREAMVLHEYWSTTYRILRELSDLANRNGLSQQFKDLFPATFKKQ